MKIVIDDKIPFINGVLEPYAEVVYLPGSKIDRKAVKDSDALIIRTRTSCNKELLQGSNVKFIATATIGYDHIDTNWCEANGILWKNAEGCNSTSVMQYLASTLVYLSKKYNFKFEDRTLGIVGVGNVGSKVLKLAEQLGMRIVLNDPPVVRRRGPCGYISLDGILREADIISLHVPLNTEGEDKTTHLFDETKLNKLNPGTILINTSRGEVLDNKVLRKALQLNRLQAAVLDVWENEPDIDLELLNLLDVATPHIAGYSADGKANGTAMSVNAVSSFFRLGLNNWFPVNVPSPEKPVISIDAKGKSEQEIISEAIECTFNVDEDTQRLKKSPGAFEAQRGNYPVRREFSSYSIKLVNGSSEISNKLKSVGFKMIE
jgi:erythronate-4-phosphate dehydrogenase